jgi:hypothetical protein
MTKEFYKLFTEFMGYGRVRKLIPSGTPASTGVVTLKALYYSKEDAVKDLEYYQDRFKTSFELHEYIIPFDSSFDALIPVVKKIGEDTSDLDMRDLERLSSALSKLEIRPLYLECLRLIAKIKGVTT